MAACAEERSFSVRAQKLLGEVDRIIRNHFFDPSLKGVDWQAEVDKTRQRLAGVHENTGVARALNDLLSSLRSSHTGLYLPSDPFYYFIASTFGRNAPGYERFFGQQGVRMPDAGLLVESRPEGLFVQSVLEGGPADQAGLHVGDRILAVDGGPWHGVDTFRAKVGRKVSVRLQHSEQGKPLEIFLVPRLINPQEAFLQAGKASARVIQRGNRRIGYYHLWAFSDPRAVDQFEDALRRGFRSCDGLIIDLREGIGGTYGPLLHPFLGDLPNVEFIDRQGQVSTSGGSWKRPLVVLVNERSRSSKELYAYAFKKKKLATLVGARTAGAVTAGSAFYLSNGSLLYVAVSRVVVDGESLEGRGVTPDVEVARPIPWSEGKDPQLEKALEIMAEKLHPPVPGGAK